MISLTNLKPALISVGVSAEPIDAIIAGLKGVLAELDEVEVKGREKLDTTLGCMMAIDAIIGEEKNG